MECLLLLVNPSPWFEHVAGGVEQDKHLLTDIDIIGLPGKPMEFDYAQSI